MNQDAASKWTIWQTFAFPAFAPFLIFFAFFINNPGGSLALLGYLNHLFHSAFITFSHFAFKIFFHGVFKSKAIDDSLLTYTAMLSFLLIAVAVSAIGTIIDEGKGCQNFAE